MQPETSEFLDFLKTTGALGGSDVAVYGTHAAMIFVGADRALKVKRAVRYDYLDFSTLARRCAALARELEINKPLAPGIYQRVAAITREADGRLALDGAGETVEWALVMRRFEQSDVLAARIAAGGLADDLVKRLADAIVRCHAAAPVARGLDGPGRMASIIRELAQAFARAPSAFADAQRAAWTRLNQAQIVRCEALLAQRAETGHVRRCHGDLHLGNIVLWKGEPTPFDAIEFDEELAVIDTLYDLAFLLMDLDERGHRGEANLVLNRYVWRRDEESDLDGLAALPLFLGLRAGIRAMVTAQKSALEEGGAAGHLEHQAAERTAAQRYFAASLGYLQPPPPQLVAIGGLSGTGKSTLAAMLAPLVGAAPGAIHLRSDLERKAMLGVGELERLAPASYTQAASDAVYARLHDKAARALKAGQAVVVDAVFAKADEQREIAAIAETCGVPFRGLWLTAPVAVLERRVAQRTGDASDAGVEVVRQQVGRAASTHWDEIDASGPKTATFQRARSVLGLSTTERMTSP